MVWVNTVITLVLGAIMLSVPVAQMTGPAAEPAAEPAYYFYSSEKRAFFIAETRETNPKLLTEYSLPDGFVVAGDGWDSDQTWFAWFARSPGGSIPNSQLFIAERNSDSPQPAAYLDNVQRIKWSYTGSLLAAAHQAEPDLQLTIIDAATHTLVLSTRISGFITHLDWTSDSAWVILTVATSPTTRTTYAISVYGQVNSYTYAYDALDCYRPEVIEPNLLVYSPDNRGTITLEPISLDGAGLDERIMMPFGNKRLLVIDPSPGGRYATLYIGQSCFDVTADLWVLSIEDRTFKRLAEDVLIPPHPTRNMISQQDERFYQVSRWSSDEKYILLDRTATHMFVYDPSSENLAGVAINEGNIVHIWWISDQEGIFILGQNGTGEIHKFVLTDAALQTNHLIKVLVNLYSLTFPSLSQDRKHLGFSSNDLCGHVCSLLIPELQLQGIEWDDTLNTVREILWSDSNSAAFFLEEAQEGQRVIHHVNFRDGSVLRLGVCSISKSCFGWLVSSASD
jgi:hypothetical protein